MKSLLKKCISILIGKKLMIKDIFYTRKAIKEAFNLFCTPRKGRIRPFEKDFLASADSVKIDTNDHKIQMYHWEGRGKTVFLLHGWESNSFRWKNLIPKLQEKNFNIIAIDGPAQGQSSGKYLSVPLYTACIKDIAAIYKPEIMIGHSLGGMTAIYYQYLMQSEFIEKIVTLGPPSELKLFLKDFQETLKVSDAFMKKLDTYLYECFGFYAADFSMAKFAKEIKQKGLLILEKYDELAPYPLSTKIARNWNECELFTVENIGHSLQDPKINKKIMEFL